MLISSSPKHQSLLQPFRLREWHLFRCQLLNNMSRSDYIACCKHLLIWIENLNPKRLKTILADFSWVLISLYSPEKGHLLLLVVTQCHLMMHSLCLHLFRLLLLLYLSMMSLMPRCHMLLHLDLRLLGRRYISQFALWAWLHDYAEWLSLCLPNCLWRRPKYDRTVTHMSTHLRPSITICMLLLHV